MKLEHQTKSGHMMMAMNKWSVDYLAVALAFAGEGLEFIGFIQRYSADTHHGEWSSEKHDSLKLQKIEANNEVFKVPLSDTINTSGDNTADKFEHKP